MVQLPRTYAAGQTMIHMLPLISVLDGNFTIAIERKPDCKMCDKSRSCAACKHRLILQNMCNSTSDWPLGGDLP